MESVSRVRVESVNSVSLSDDIDDSLSVRSSTIILDVITKQTLIGTSIIICNVGFLLQASVEAAFLDQSSWIWMIAYMERAIEGVAVSCLLYLGLSVNDAAYQKVCSRCHRRCYDCARQRFKNELKRDYYQMQELDHH